jgi:hypothetical protein
MAAFSQAPHTYEGAVKNISPGGRGAGDMLSMVSALNRAVSRPVSDDRARKVLAFVDRSLANFDFTEFYGSRELEKLDDGYRGVIFSGTDNGSCFRFRVLPAGQGADLSRMGNFTAEFGLKKNERGTLNRRTYSGRIDVHASQKNLSHRSLGAFIKGNLLVIDPHNIQRLPVSSGGNFPGLNDDAARVLAAYRAAFPSFTAHMLRYFPVNSFIAAPGPGPVKYTRLNFTASLNMDALGKDYPSIAGYLGGMQGLFRLQVRVRNEHGNNVLKFTVDSDRNFFTATLLTREGRLIPFGDDGEPFFSREIDMSTVQKYRFTSSVDFYSNVYGLRFSTRGISSVHDFTDWPGGGVIRNRIDSIPGTRVTGWAFHLVHPWFIDLVIPGNMEQLIADFSTVMVRANGGRGSTMDFSWDTSRPGDTRFRYLAATEFIDNFFIRFGLRIWKMRVLPDGNAAGEMKTGMIRALSALEDDLRRLAEK